MIPDQVQVKIQAVRDRGAELALARRKEMALEDERPLVKSEAIARIMALPDPQKGSLYSATAAEKIVETDKVYWSHRMAQQHAVQVVQTAWAEYDAAKLEAQAEVAMLAIAADTLAAG